MATKAELCQKLYGEMAAASEKGEVARKDFINRAVAECGCTPAGASTYYSNCKTKHNGGTVKSYYQKADTVKVNNAVDDSQANNPTYSIVVVDDGKTAGTSSYATPDRAIEKYNSMKPASQAMCVVVEGSPNDGTPISSLKLIDTARS